MVDKMDKGIGQYLRKVREEKGGKGFWSVRSVAKRANISNSYLSQLELGQIKQPLPDILKKLSSALRVPYEELLHQAGYLKHQPFELDQTNILKIPIWGEVSAGKLKMIPDVSAPEDFIQIEYDLIKNRNCFAVRASGDSLKNLGIFDGDILIIAKDIAPQNGDIVVIRVEDEAVCKKYYYDSKTEQIILEPANDHYERIVISKKDMKQVEIIGKIIRAVKTF